MDAASVLLIGGAAFVVGVVATAAWVANFVRRDTRQERDDSIATLTELARMALETMRRERREGDE